MMTRMIEKYATKKSIKYQILENTEYNTVIRLEKKYSYFECLAGLHKIVRVSPFGKGDKVHTSLCKISVDGPKKQYKVNLVEKDIRMDFFKSTGPGGQHRNKVMSAVRLVHIPTGVTVISDAERSQHDNRRYAYEQLQCKLENILSEKEKTDYKENKKQEKLNEIVIASYYFNHQMSVNDKNGVKTTKVKQLFNGDMDEIFTFTN